MSGKSNMWNGYIQKGKRMNGQFDFPTIEWWRENVVYPSDQEQYFKRHFYEYYLQKYMIALMFQPKTIAEIGVRYGYSAFSFLQASPEASYIGYDISEGSHGGVKGDTFEYAWPMLNKSFPDAIIMLLHTDTRKLDSLDGKFDFIHIDGDHSEKGCENDLELALKACYAGGAILVDDYDYIDGVKRAVDNFVEKNDNKIERYFRMPSLRGEFILIKGKDA